MLDISSSLEIALPTTVSEDSWRVTARACPSAGTSRLDPASAHPPRVSQLILFHVSLRWVSQHDVHHWVTNHPEHDPDIQLLPFFAFTSQCFKGLYSTFHSAFIPFDAPSQFLVQIQHLTFYPVMVFARFSLIGKSYHYVSPFSRPSRSSFDASRC